MRFILHTFQSKPILAPLRLFATALLLGMALAQMPTSNARAQAGNPQLILTKSIEGNITNAKVGDVIRYRIRFECSSLTTSCGIMQITDDLPAGLTYLPPPNSSVPGGFTISESGGTVTITKDDNDLLDGSQYDAVIAVRVDYDLRPLPTSITNTVEGWIDPPGPVGVQNATPASAPPVTIDTVTVNWTLAKTRISPAIEPTLDTDVTYQIQLCPAASSGNVALSNIVITDNLPTVAVFVSATNGGTFSGGVVTWNIAGPVTPPNCVARYVTINYPNANFNIGDPITNTARATAQYITSGGGVCVANCYDSGDVPINHNIINIVEVPTYSKDDVGDPVGITGTARFTLTLNTNGTNWPANAVTLIDNLPPELQVTSVTSGMWSASFDYVRAYVEYSTNYGSTWTAFPGQPVSYTGASPYAAPVTNITNVRWRFEYDFDGDGTYTPGLPYTWQFTTEPEIRVTPRATATTADPPSGAALPAVDPLTLPQTYTNCLQVSRINSGGNPVTGACDNEPITVQGDYVSLRVTKNETPGASYDNLDDPNINTFTSDGSILPGDTLRYTLTVNMTERSSEPLVDPTILDTLPADLIFVRNGTARLDGAVLATQPAFTRSGPNPGAGQSLRWDFTGLTVPVQPLGSHLLTVEFFARIPPGQTPGTRQNDIYVVTDSTKALCEPPSGQTPDSTDVDGDGDVTEAACEYTDDYIVERSAALRGEKWIRSVAAQNSQVVDAFTFLPASCPNGGTVGLPTGGSNPFTRFPCISQAFPENSFINNQFVPPPVDPTLDDFEYNLRIFNDGNVDMIDYVLYDILPYYGDKGSGGTLANSPRNSEFRPALRGPIQFISGTGLTAADFTIEYNATANPCRPEVFNQSPGNLIPAGCDNTWTTVWSTAARSYRIRLNAGSAIPPAGANEVRFGVPMYIPADAPPVGTFSNDDPLSHEIAWNSFSHVGSYDSGTEIRDLLASEPRKVGITIPEVMSIGNRVWRDSDNSGTINPPDDTSPGIANVVVNLYRDADNNGTPDGVALASTTTDSGGYYLFSNIPYNSSDATQNRYIVGIPAVNFNAGQPLNTLRSSTGTPASAAYTNPPESNPDREDHGRDPAVPGQEVLSATIILQPATEQADETDLSANNRDGIPGARRGVNGERDNNSDLTVDFGFFGGTDIPFSIGNHVWYDNGAGGGTVNDGIRQAGEPPVPGARVELYRDGNGNGIPEGPEYIRFDVTDANGFYLFDNLDPGTYFVLVVPGNFTNSFDPDGAGPLPAAPGVLRGWYSSQITGTENAGVAGNPYTPNMDSDDNGVDTNTPELNGVYSVAIVLTRDPAFPEPAGESHLSNQPDPGLPTNDDFNPTGWDGPLSRGRYLESDTSSNLTVDFGFIPPMSLGNRVWFDGGAGEVTFRAGFNNGLMDGTETGVGGVRVELWRDANGNSTLDAGEFIRFTTTDANGYYLFDRIQPGVNYYVHIPASNFASGAPLENYISSYDLNQTTAPADDAEDRDDNGVDNANPATNGITSPAFAMAYTTEPVTETDFSSDTATYGTNNVGLFGQADNNSNLTMDFGFVRPPRSLGNRLWFDVGGGAGGVVNDGIRNGTEGPVVNARVSLYLDANTDGQPDDLGVAGNRTDDWIAFDLTDANGYYLFDNLPPNNYIVGVDRDNFATGVLIGFTSSTGNVDNASSDLDNRDNGVDRPLITDPTASPHGILSTRINLTATPITLPSGETGSGDTLGSGLTNNPTSWDGPIPGSRGRYGETDANSDLTIDFGFAEAYSIGNRVWFDTNNNAIMDAGEVGVDGVQVQVYLAAITLPTGSVLATTTTANGGYYLFDHLPPEDYVVVITADNFDSTGTYNALVGYWSSLTDRSGANGAIAETAAPDPDLVQGIPGPSDDDIDLDDNGFRRTPAGAFQNAVLALPVTVGPTGLSEPTNDDDLDITLPGSQQGQPDGRANMKVDFGFYRTEIGNLVYEDVNLNGTYNAGIDNLIDGARVRLYQQNNNTEVNIGPDGILGTADDAANGVVTGPLAGVHPAWGNGEYHFSGLPAGDYIVRVTAMPAAFPNMVSTIDTFDQADNDNPDVNTDNNDNGDGTGTVNVTSDITNRLTTVPGSTGAQNNNTVTQSSGTTTDNTVDFGFVKSYSLGNRVWYDTNNNGVRETGATGEAGINGVRVELYRDTNGNGSYTPGVDTFVAFATTAANSGANGYYRFDNLFPGEYIVVLPGDNFRNVGVGDTVPGDPLRSYWSTGTTINAGGAIGESATNDPDNNFDASAVAASSDDNGATTFSGNTINYVAAAAITLGGEVEPVNDDDPVATSQANEAPDNRSNRTVDFGFYRVEIGNLVFSDNDISGHFNAGDTALSGVLVHLFASNGTTEIITGADGIPGTADDGFGPDGVVGGGDDGTGGVRTNGTGNYLFSGLPQGNYIVKVDAPAGTVSTIDSNPQADNDNPNTNTDNNDNGDGVAGGTVTFDAGDSLNMNPGVDALKPNRTVSNATGTTTDPTIDFGFIGMVAIGNRVWVDDGAGIAANANNGRLDAGETGVNNVTVQLYGLGIDGIAGTPDDNLVAVTATANIGVNTGYYQFDNLFPGQYYVRIPAGEFNPGGDLVGYTSSTGNGGVNDDDDQFGVNGDENGIDSTALTTNGIVTPVYTLQPGTEPTTDEHAGIYTGTLGNANVNFTADFGFFQPFSIGNRVFRDDGAGGGAVNNGIMDGTELPIANVRVELYRDTNGTPGLQVGTDTFLRFDLTDAGGYYLFDELTAGEYYIHIPAANFTGAGPLLGLYSSAPTGSENAGVAGNPYIPNTDRDDNGVNNPRPDLNGVSSGPIILAQSTEPAGETELSGDTGAAAGNNPTVDDGPNSRGRYGESDNNSNLTVDFGFIPPLSLGNRVWIDSGSTPGGPVISQFNDGIMNGNEPGRGGVLLNLYFDADNDGNYTGGETTPYATTVTDASGYYLFDKLPPGRFYVQAAPSNFAAGGALEGFTSSTGQSLSEILDVNDNGIDDVNYLTNGIASVNFILNHAGEPINETDINNTGIYGPNNVGLFGQTNADSNLTLDFGFVQPPRSLGNRLWFDDNNNGVMDGGELPVQNARVSLYSDGNNDGQPDDINVIGNQTDNWLAWDLTDSGGYYLFDNLPPGRYLAGVDNTNFQSGQPLFEYNSSTGNVDNASNDTDRLDNGIDRTAPGDPTASPYGILSTSINLSAGAPTGEADLSADTGSLPGNNPTEDDGPGSIGRNGETDAASDLTIDFGFVKPMSLGNRVFFDNGAGNAAFLDNGIMNAGELPIANVRVELYRDTDGTAGLQVGTDTLVRFDLTDAGGYYLFDNLAPGEYYVHIPAVNFTTGALQGMNNSAPTGTENAGVAGNPNTPNTDRDDNGVNNTRPDLNGISSGPILLVRDAEPSGETELSSDTGTAFGDNPTVDDGPNSRGRYGEGDNNSNLTVDFGFVPVYSLGNRVWLDTGGTTGVPNNGVMDGDEAGINGVTVRLYRDSNNDGTPDGPSIQTTNTDVNGYYRFNNLTAGTYIVEVVPPAGLGSTVDVGQDPDDNADLDDNGVIVLVSGEVRSKPITLGDLPEPTGEEPAPNPDSANGEAPDAQSNRTVDFGFVGAVAIGNVVWFDTGAGANYNNGIFDIGEVGVDNITVQLFTAAGVEVPIGADGILGTVDDGPGGMVTSGGGYYRFDRLIPGGYYVYIPAAEFQSGGQLYTYLSSTDSIPATTSQTADNDADENGIDGTPANPLTVNGIRTIAYNLTPGTMPTGEGQSNYGGALPDNSVNFTADFGFVEAYSLGNRVWFDTDRNGTRDAGEDIGPLPAGIPVNLYRDSNNDGNPDDINIIGDLTDDILLSTLTDAAGFYRFDNLTAGSYIVEVLPPVGYASTVDAGDPDTDPDDDDDNGVNFVGANVRSDTVTLEPGNFEPTAENNPAVNPEASLGEAPDNRSNRTVDFGFFVSATASEKQLTSTVMMDNGPTPGTDVTTTPEVAIGEILTYVTRLRIPSGERLTNLRAVDQLDAGLAFVGCDSIIASDPGLTTDLVGGYDAACNNPGTTLPANPLVAPRTGSHTDATQITFALGEVFNNTAQTQILSITYRVIVLNVPGNQDGIGGLNNSVTWLWGGGSQLPVRANPVEVVEPDLSIDKRAVPASAPYGSTIGFTIDIAHTSQSSTDAFDVVVTDIIPAGLALDASSIQVTGTVSTPGNFNFTYDPPPGTNTLTVTWDVFPIGSTGRITFNAVFVGPAPVVNNGNVRWSSLPIDPQPGGAPVLLSNFNDYSTERWYDPTDLTGLNPYGRSDSVTINLPEEDEKENPWTLPATGFAPNVITELPLMPEGFAYFQTSLQLEIPKFKQTLNIAGVPYNREKREWNLTWLNTEAGWLENTAFPTHAGNSALTAHITLPNGQPGPFAKLSTLSYGDQIIVHLGGQKYIFEVRDNKQVKPAAVKSTLKHEEYPWLTLITCKSYNEKTDEYTYRTVIRAVLVEVVDE